ncbi:hypothetical protein AB0N38_33475, partial [Micromonospora aurantiaca]|uniref:hypothetical protein n=1 Tax=Micromonospora aurantiaca (nom. illeg.) TaxID=47850 RepID=UPI0034283B69
ATACRHRATLPVSPVEVMPPRRPQQTFSNTLSDLAAHDIELDLDALERGDRTIGPDEDGDPRLY